MTLPSAADDRSAQHATCTACGSHTLQTFHRVQDVPTNSVLLLGGADEARSVARGDIELALCESCGFVLNVAFDPTRTEYSGRYESTQAFSGTFNAFNTGFATEMVERFDLRGKTVLEIGCGHGEFLVQLCEFGHNRGIGFDPAHHEGLVEIPAGIDIEFIPDFYGPRYADRPADFIVCKMTLEHIVDASGFVQTLRSSVGDRLETVVCFQVPNAEYVFGEQAFWDVYYEHCSYFTSDSLTALFEREGFDVIDTWTGYDDQYLMLAARPSLSADAEGVNHDITTFVEQVDRFKFEVPSRIGSWRATLDRATAQGLTTVIWGGGSKGVAFLTTVGISEQVSAVVDVNPRKAGTFMAGTGHAIIGPDGLRSLDPDVVIIMNPVYVEEIRHQLDELGVSAEVLTIT